MLPTPENVRHELNERLEIIDQKLEVDGDTICQLLEEVEALHKRVETLEEYSRFMQNILIDAITELKMPLEGEGYLIVDQLLDQIKRKRVTT